MAPENRISNDEPFRELDTQLAALRTAAKSLREDRPSWADNIFHPGRRARQEADFSAAVVSALKEFGASVRNTLARQASKVAELERQLSDWERRLSELRSEQLTAFQNEFRQLGEQQERLAREQAETVATATTRAAELREQVEQFRRDYGAKVEQLAAEQKDLGNEFRERIQHLLDEQRVSIRQLALKASEDAILADRARRATELKLEELAKRLPSAPPA